MVKKSEIPSLGSHQEVPVPPLSQVLIGLMSPDRYAKGEALELLAIRLTHSLGLDFEGWLLRSANSNGIEVEIVASDKRVPFNRWLIQCRNTHQMDMGDIATAVGRSVSLRPGIVLSVTTGHFTQQARHYATRAMQLTNLQILLLDAHDLGTIANDETAIRGILGREAGQAKSAKELQLAPLYA
jgi:hypothetical protein